MASGRAVSPLNTATLCSAVAPEVATEEGWGVWHLAVLLGKCLGGPHFIQSDV